MARETQYLVRKELRSPQSAAIAGILFSFLMAAIMIMTFKLVRSEPEQITGAWLEAQSDRINLVLLMAPFAGISFLWFTGVIRDRLGYNEDRFFATIFLGSGIIFVLLLFIWAAVFGAMMKVTILADDDIYSFGLAFMSQILGNYGLRMAGLFMTAIATLWNRTRHVPRWLTITTYILAFVFLFATNWIRELRFVFPVWVFVVSVRILILNYRDQSNEPGGK